jgi:hypothetical protein
MWSAKNRFHGENTFVPFFPVVPAPDSGSREKSPGYRGMAEKTKKTVQPALPRMLEPDTTYRRKCRITWAALIKVVYEVDPLKCPKCGGEMKIVAFIEEKEIVERILRHYDLWQERKPHPLSFHFKPVCS